VITVVVAAVAAVATVTNFSLSKAEVSLAGLRIFRFNAGRRPDRDASAGIWKGTPQRCSTVRNEKPAMRVNIPNHSIWPEQIKPAKLPCPAGPDQSKPGCPATGFRPSFL
jgi:hypothetical protein